MIFGIKDDKTRLVPCRPVDEETEKREYRERLKKKIAEREKMQKVRRAHLGLYRVIADGLEGCREGVVRRSGVQVAQNGWNGTLGGG